MLRRIVLLLLAIIVAGAALGIAALAARQRSAQA